ncbi:hypothetical protein DL240_16100 [Lujinxingia litoralis]|uniref:Co-chaperone DjlA N-terminal domain-containing protein n=1 Tax=Lujinxingia litoralis TaxID=2211119 RepID=A0A328C494_9DELT|nr:hypothetical protein [Lujinxingia litoralis]RAL20558.1 hypothetical protein DL240_16100 [Lujinxingia litoralis]
MADRKNPREEEEKYIKQQEAAKLQELRREKQLEAIRQQEREAIAASLNTDEEVAAEAMALGFDAETARVLPLLPLIQMAWADGTISNAETAKVQELADRFGIAEGTPAANFLTMLLEEEPTDHFFSRANVVIAHMIDEDPEGTMGEDMIKWSKAVAEASGGFFGLTNPIAKEEGALLDDFARLFGVKG